MDEPPASPQPPGRSPQPVARRLRSYTSLGGGLLRSFSEFHNIYRFKSRPEAGVIRGLIDGLRVVEDYYERTTGRDLRGLSVLDIGPGQNLSQSKYFSAFNDVVAIDLDFLPDRAGPSAYWQILRRNGARRAMKSLARGLLGLDARFDRELRRQLEGPTFRPIRRCQMDAARIGLADRRFDLVYSCSVFEHLETPQPVLAESRRLLRPGGVAYHIIHPYTSENGNHDPRVFSGNRSQIPYWAHLRPVHAHATWSNAYLNRLRLADWRSVCRDALEGLDYEFLVYRTQDQALISALHGIRAGGDLGDFDDEEILMTAIVVRWIAPTR
ncbi:hypothetical protein BH23PLA1_BH23PLA1_40900 [soil metagenome]